MKYVLVCPEKGVFVGFSLGLAFWSALDTAGQSAVPVCDTEEQAKELRRHLGEPDTTEIVEIDLPDSAKILSADGCVQYGFPWKED